MIDFDTLSEEEVKDAVMEGLNTLTDYAAIALIREWASEADATDELSEALELIA